MWSCVHKTLRSGVECAGYRTRKGWGEVVLHPNGRAGDIFLMAWPLAFFPSILGLLLGEQDCQAAKLVLQAQVEDLSVEEYIRARVSLSQQGKLVRLRGLRRFC